MKPVPVALAVPGQTGLGCVVPAMQKNRFPGCSRGSLIAYYSKWTIKYKGHRHSPVLFWLEAHVCTTAIHIYINTYSKNLELLQFSFTSSMLPYSERMVLVRYLQGYANAKVGDFFLLCNVVLAKGLSLLDITTLCTS